jgi:hypothetical protein
LKILSSISKNLINFPGYKTNRKIVVIESDDWGTIRMKDRETYLTLKNKGLLLDQCAYNQFDTLESNDDLLQLFETLSSVRDVNNNPAVFTCNNIVGNPDFKRIAESGFAEYYYEPFTTTLERYPNRDNVLGLYREGISSGVVKPQFHGREHVNIERWLFSLRHNDRFAKLAFEHGMFSVREGNPIKNRNEYMDALDIDSIEQIEKQRLIVLEGLDLFKRIWGGPSLSFIAPCYIWPRNIESSLSEGGVLYIQGTVIQLDPQPTPGFVYRKRYHYTGQKNEQGQYYLCRNAFFEPSSDPSFDWVGGCMNRMEIAFRWRKPVIISTHRVNFMGAISERNRVENLKLLKTLLLKIKNKWPDVEFLSSDQLGQLISQK